MDNRKAKGLLMIVAILLFVGITFAYRPRSEVVQVKYRGKVDLRTFKCTEVSATFVKRVCYDDSNQYMLISLNGVYYHYCEIDRGTVSNLLSAESKGGFYNAQVR